MIPVHFYTLEAVTSTATPCSCNLATRPVCLPVILLYQFYGIGSQRIVQKTKSTLPTQLGHATIGTNDLAEKTQCGHL